VARAVLAGRLSLPEAASQFLALRREVQASYPNVPRLADDLSEEEDTCREVIAWVRAELAGDPERAREVTVRLEAELDAHLRRGPLRLPPRQPLPPLRPPLPRPQAVTD
jgi:hypothetical protein